MSQLPKNIYKLDITESGGVTKDLVNGFLNLLKKNEYHLLVEEGGVDMEQHYHLHAIVGSGYSTTQNFRKKVMKPLYIKSGREESFTPVGLKVKTVKPEHLDGALSYVYKEKRVLSSKGIDLNSIKKWKDPNKIEVSGRMKKFTRVTHNNFVASVVKYIDVNGVSHPGNYMDVRNVINDMMSEDYLFSFDGRTRSQIGQILQVFGSRSYALSHLDDLCNFHC